MNEEAPDSKEVAHFHFNQLRTLKIAKGGEEVPKDSLNVIAPASKYGLLFVGISNGFKVLKLENILDLDEDKENKSIEENYYCQVVYTEAPILLSLSADQKTLAVCVKRNTNVFADMYDIAAFADPEEKPEPFQNVLMSLNNSKLKDLMWNPVTDGMYAYCMSDGSLSVHELAGMKLTVVATLPGVGATAACWSPKGKQIVIGKKDGSLSQYKPTLQEMKSIPAPSGEKYSVANICWVSTAQFAVLYVPEGQGVCPCLYIVSTPKNAPVLYMNFFDICLGNASSDDQRYFIHHESAWGVLVCASTDSIEVAVLGDSPSWVQWEVRDDCRALLPAKNGSKNASAMGVMYCSQRNIVISETEVYPPMPIIFYLTDNGLLVSYHLVNSAPGSVSLVRPSTPIDRENERKRPEGSQNQLAPAVSSQTFVPQPPTSAVPAVVPTSAFQSTPPVNASVPSLPSGTPLSFGFNQNNSFTRNEPQTPTFGAIPFQSTAKAPPSSVGPFRTPSTPATPLENERFHKTSKGMSVGTTTPSVNKDTTGIRHLAVAQRSISGSKPEFEKDSHVVDTDTSLKSSQPQVSLVGTGDSNIVQKESTSNQHTYLAAIFEEVQTFEKEMHDLKKSSDLMTDIGTKEEMADLMSCTLKFQEFLKGMSETMASLNSDIHSLKNSLLESFVLIEEANSKEKRHNDHSYISMLKDRALDPMTAKRMQTIEQHYTYLSTQLHAVSNKLDMDFFEYLERKRENKKATRQVSSTEGIYKTIQSISNSIQNLQTKVLNLSKKATIKKLDNIYRKKNKSQFVKRSDSEELSKLADVLLQTKIASSEDEKPQLQKKMSSSAQNILKQYLSSSTITSVRPTIIYSPAQSRFLSKSLLYAEQPDSSKTEVNVSSSEQPAIVQPQLDKVTPTGPNLTPSSVMKPVITNQPPMLIPSSNLETFTNENKTPISKPRVTSAVEFEKLRQQNRGPTFGENTNTVNKPVSQFTSPALSFMPPKQVAAPVSPPVEIASPIYEDITPPDSPDLSRYTHDMPESKTIQVSFNQGVAEVQQGSPPSVFDKKSLTSDRVDKFQTLQDAKQTPSGLFLNALNTADTNYTSFGPPTATILPTTKLSTGASTADVGSKNETNLTEQNKTPENVFNPLSKPMFGKPATTTSVFSFFTPTSSLSFPTFSTTSTSSFFSTPVKKDESVAKPQQPSTVAASTKATSDGSEKVPTTSSFFSTPGVVLDQNKTSASSFLPAAKSIFSVPEKKPDGFGFSLPLPANQSSGSETSSFFNKPAAKEFSFFHPTAVTASTGSQFSLAPKPGKDTPESPKSDSDITKLTTEASESQPSNSEVSPNPVVTSPEEPTIDQSPINLSQKPTEASVAIPQTSVETTSPISVTTTAAPNPVEASSITAVPGTQTAIVNPSGLVFGQPPLTTSAPATTALSVSQGSAILTNIPSVFGPIIQNPPVSILPAPALDSTAPVAPTVFSQPPATPALFSAPVVAGVGSAFGQAPGTTSSFFDQSAGSKSSFFEKAVDKPVFGQTSVFGSTATTTASGSFPQASGTFFSQPAGGQTSVFGGSPATNDTGNSGFVAQPAAAKSPFGQTQGSFGLAKSVFGQQSNATTSVFGQPASPASNTASFGQTAGNSVFGQGSFFSGLGGAPTAENASKNVFAAGNITTQPSESNVFGATAFGAKTGSSFTGGSFSSGGGTVAQSGFGAFQQQTPQKAGGFGAAPAFGGAPSFGSPTAFGSPPSFGGGCSLGSVFGASQQSAQNANFSNFATASSPTFGSLASQSPGGFGNAQQNPQSAFGQSSPFAAAPVFGSTPAFGGQQPSGFGNPSGATGNSSAFTQWRN